MKPEVFYGEKKDIKPRFQARGDQTGPERGVAVAQAAKGLDVHDNVLRKRVREMRDEPQEAFPGNGKQRAQDAEIARLRKEVAKLKIERDILKKCRSLLRERVDVKFGFVAKHRGAWPVNLMYEALGV